MYTEINFSKIQNYNDVGLWFIDLDNEIDKDMHTKKLQFDFKQAIECFNIF